MSLDEEALQEVAIGGSMNLEKWSEMVPALLERLDYIVYNVFPMPKLPPGSQAFSQPPTQSTDTSMAPPESSNKENTAPEDPMTVSGADAAVTSPSATERVPDSQPQSSEQTNDTLPPALALLLTSIRSAIQSFFIDKPPHTIQRLAELILRPRASYKTLPAYLRAVDRVVSVTSGADIFPFNTPGASELSNGLLHPTNSAGTYLTPDYAHGLGSDESLGGALLTPIPWLTNASFEDAEAGALEVDDSGDLQSRDVSNPGAAAAASTIEGEGGLAAATATSPRGESPDEVPHARGPSVVGVEDLGLQDGKGVEMSLEAAQLDGAAGDITAEASTSSSEETNVESAPAAPDSDGDIVLEDSKPKEEESKPEEPAAQPQVGEEKPEAAADAAQSADTEKA